jgi:hypothetical protein
MPSQDSRHPAAGHARGPIHHLGTGCIMLRRMAYSQRDECVRALSPARLLKIDARHVTPSSFGTSAAMPERRQSQVVRLCQLTPTATPAPSAPDMPFETERR